jgi:DNA-binding response OmpR family regulator
MARILLAEDDAAVREFVRRALIHSGHHVTAVDNGHAAKAALAAEAFDLLLSDIVMPGLDGIDLALHAAGADRDMAILLMTGYAAERQRAHRIDALAYRVIAKPFTLREICAAVNETLARRDTQTSVA